jgi:hypothetical protein
MRDGWKDLVQHVSIEASKGFVVEFTPVFKSTDVGIAGMDRIRPWWGVAIVNIRILPVEILFKRDHVGIENEEYFENISKSGEASRISLPICTPWDARLCDACLWDAGLWDACSGRCMLWEMYTCEIHVSNMHTLGDVRL